MHSSKVALFFLALGFLRIEGQMLVDLEKSFKGL